MFDTGIALRGGTAIRRLWAGNSGRSSTDLDFAGLDDAAAGLLLEVVEAGPKRGRKGGRKRVRRTARKTRGEGLTRMARHEDPAPGARATGVVAGRAATVAVELEWTMRALTRSMCEAWIRERGWEMP
jgi:hypothetical protein